MGRYPLKAAIEKYLKVRENMVGESTWKNERRYLNHIADNLETMRERKQIATTNPELISPKEVRAFIKWMNDSTKHRNNKPLDLDTQVRYLAKLENVLVMNGNKVIERMKADGYQFPQKVSRKPIRALTEDKVKQIQRAALKIGSTTGEPPSWREAKARFLMAAYVATGLRPSELRLAQYADLDQVNWKIYVRSPKGEGKYANNRRPEIIPPYRGEFVAFLKERENLLRYYGIKKAIYLIPNLRGGKDTYYSSNHFRKLKKEVQEVSGVDFRLKDFRPTFASLTVAKDPNLLIDVSTQLGHSNLTTTQRYYAQISADSAGSRISKAWEKDLRSTAPPATAGEVDELLKTLGIGSIEELKAVIKSNAANTENRGIDFKNGLPGYY